MINKKQLYHILENTNLNPWKAEIFENVFTIFSDPKHGDLKKWKSILENLPQINPSIINLNSAIIQIGISSDIDSDKKNTLTSMLKRLHPWRKGPFNLFDIYIDTEWRSDLKWDRLKDHIASLKDRIVLDVGCGSGYHAFRMAGQGSRLVIGLEPFLLSVIQFRAINHFVNSPVIQILPMGIEKFQYISQAFDTVFSMGVLYHRRSPFDHLSELRSHLRSGGELVLETLVIDGKKDEVLVPEDRYAKMRNVWFIPSCLTLESWLKRSRYKNIRLIYINKTTIEEQRSSEWMHYESLAEFLDPNDSTKTVEGLPAPKRAIFLAEAP
ncbi:MAG: tRNA 5-methoxyuridine(34)/uridine 5-oxyacetic acid(34) synthase CmoB [Calditrichaceae bacterium]|nr:tRNA 5-methoxyuridine(34)/uridine 5-oxyacetic acid(34) synthase CmoB [Calditrichaceae bacterium]HES58804.1 tRNA 5-methoxyuridine(34)/uridine 5-oxyacetic acid(34) synthase CmoB [Caldithrix sp.]